MAAKIKEKRVIKGYKVRPSKYNKAMRRAKKENTKLATLIEDVINNYASGVDGYWFGEKPNSDPVSVLKVL